MLYEERPFDYSHCMWQSLRYTKIIFKSKSNQPCDSKNYTNIFKHKNTHLYVNSRIKHVKHSQLQGTELRQTSCYFKSLLINCTARTKKKQNTQNEKKTVLYELKIMIMIFGATLGSFLYKYMV